MSLRDGIPLPDNDNLHQTMQFFVKITMTSTVGGYRRLENELSSRLRGMLHRPVDIITDSGHAEWQARRSSMHTIGQRIPLQDLRIARSSEGMQFFAAIRGNVRIMQGGGHGDSEGVGKTNHTNHGWTIAVIKNHERTRMDTNLKPQNTRNTPKCLAAGPSIR